MSRRPPDAATSNTTPEKPISLYDLPSQRLDRTVTWYGPITASASKEPVVASRDFRIAKMLPPDPSREMYPGMWLFEIHGPGFDQSKLYVANELSCGTHLVKILQSVRDAALTEVQKP